MFNNSSRKNYRHWLVRLSFKHVSYDWDGATIVTNKQATGVMISQHTVLSGEEQGKTKTLVLTSKKLMLGIDEGTLKHDDHSYDGEAVCIGYEKPPTMLNFRNHSGPFKLLKGLQFESQRMWAMCEVIGFPECDNFPRPENEISSETGFTFLQVSHFDENHEVRQFHARYTANTFLHPKDSDIIHFIDHPFRNEQLNEWVRLRYYLRDQPPGAPSPPTADHRLKCLRAINGKYYKTYSQDPSLDIQPSIHVTYDAGEGAPVFDNHGHLVGIVVMNAVIANMTLMLAWTDVADEALEWTDKRRLRYNASLRGYWTDSGSASGTAEAQVTVNTSATSRPSSSRRGASKVPSPKGSTGH